MRPSPKGDDGMLIAVAAPSAGKLRDAACRLARELELPLADDPAGGGFSWLLRLTARGLELRQAETRSPGPVYVDFVSGRLAYRRRFGGGRRQPLARAVGLKGGVNPYLVDATAGLGRDAFVLACLGCRVHMVERSPIIAALLRDGLERAALDPEIGPLIRARLRLSGADSRVFLAALADDERPDVVYLDPMYPQRVKTAWVKKELRALRQLVGDNQDAPELLAAALAAARRRVVVKRPRRAPPLAGPPPGFPIEAENTRFDVYLI